MQARNQNGMHTKARPELRRDISRFHARNTRKTDFCISFQTPCFYLEKQTVIFHAFPGICNQTPQNSADSPRRTDTVRHLRKIYIAHFIGAIVCLMKSNHK